MKDKEKLPPIGHIKEGTLHSALGIKQDRKIGQSLLSQIVNAPIGTHLTVFGKSVVITALMKKKAQFALNMH